MRRVEDSALISPTRPVPGGRKTHGHPMKILLVLILYAALVSAQTSQNNAEARFNMGFTITTSGTPVRIAAQSLKVDRLMIQSKPSNTGTVIVMLGVPTGTACNSSSGSQISGYLTPGLAFSDPQGANGNAPAEYEDLQFACLDSTANNDIIVVTGWRRN
jgi:hypothetical protein